MLILKNSIVSISQNAVSAALAGEAIILDPQSGVYYGLNTVAAGIWNLLQKPKTVSEIRDLILQEYEIDFEQCEQDLLALLQQLEVERLIEVKDETGT